MLNGFETQMELSLGNFHDKGGSMSKMTTNTWRFKVGLACWDFQLATDGIPRGTGWKQKLLAIRLYDLIGALDGFAVIELVSITTREKGEDTEVLKSEELGELKNILQVHEDIEEIVIDLNLKCLGDDGVEVIIRNGAILWLQLENEGDRDSPLRLLVSLNVDLYSPKTLGEFTNNEKLAALNAPRLTSFLERIRTEVNGELMDIDAPSYSGLIDRTGFLLK